MKIPFIDLHREYSLIKPEILKTLEATLDSQHFILGENVKQFEKECAGYLGAKYAIGVASGTDALLLSLMALDIKSGDEVITTPFTFFATAGAIARLGAVPVFADIELDSYNLDPISVESKITNKTKAILPVHLFGQSADMKSVMDLSSRYNIPIIEDSCQSFGEYNKYFSKYAGTIGDIGCFSFFPTKNLGGYGDGGLVTTNDDDLAKKILRLRVHGSEKKYYHKEIGINSRLDELQAAILKVKIKYVDDWNKKRQEIAEFYSSNLKNIVFVPKIHPMSTHIFHQYVIATDRRDELLVHLNNLGIGAGVYYPLPLHLQECFSYLEYKEGDCPNAEAASKKVLSLPIFPFLSKSEHKYVVDSTSSLF